MSELKDVFGNVANVGDKIAAGMSFGQSSVLRIGEIIGIKDKVDNYNRVTYSIRVRWTHNGSENYRWGVKESTIIVRDYYTYAKFVVLPKDYVAQFPDDIKRDDEASID